MRDRRIDQARKENYSRFRRLKRDVGLGLLWAAGWGAAAISVLEGLLNALRHSQDFQWSPTALLLHHIDPWQYTLAGNSLYSSVLGPTSSYCQAFYLHFLYLVLAPLGVMSFPVARTIWAFCNLFFAGLSLCLVKQIFQLTHAEWGITCIAFLCGLSFRNALGNGQQTLLVLVFVALAYSAQITWRKSLWFGLSYFKDSFAPPFVFDLLFSQPIGIVLVSLSPALVGILWAHWMLGGPWQHLIIEPVLVTRAIGPGVGDLMALVDTFFPWRRDQSVLFFTLEYGVPFLAAAAAAWYMRFKSGLRGVELTQAMAAIYSTAALLLFRHLGYDYLFLVFAFALAMKYRQQQAARVILICIGYFWFVLKVEALLGLHMASALLVLNFLLLNLVVSQLLRIHYAERVQPAFE
jgi:hypothetical protein